MINLIGLCNFLKEKYPNPANSKLIYNSIVEFLGSEPEKETQRDIVKVLSADWTRKGWTWDTLCALKLEQGEQVLFHGHGLTLLKEDPSFPAGTVAYLPVKFGEIHPRIVWFQ